MGDVEVDDRSVCSGERRPYIEDLVDVRAAFHQRHLDESDIDALAGARLADTVEMVRLGLHLGGV
ncbi:MAG: hypothetical protein J07HX64_00090 [halophilic archaeon J07HX64]|nr:MAG: hypothetical protein J07HX64_00090 [halophilic archaeon J07HX64]